MAHEFNYDIDRRYEIWKGGEVPQSTTQLPWLIKQERESMALVFKILSKKIDTETDPEK